MTARERAEALCYGRDTTCEHTSSGLACHECILAAIEAAEAAAYERAAEALDDVADSIRGPGIDTAAMHARAAWRQAAAAVRALYRPKETP